MDTRTVRGSDVNLETSDSVILELQNAYDELVKEGKYQNILDRYLK